MLDFAFVFIHIYNKVEMSRIGYGLALVGVFNFARVTSNESVEIFCLLKKAASTSREIMFKTVKTFLSLNTRDFKYPPDLKTKNKPSKTQLTECVCKLRRFPALFKTKTAQTR